MLGLIIHQSIAITQRTNKLAAAENFVAKLFSRVPVVICPAATIFYAPTLCDLGHQSAVVRYHNDSSSFMNYYTTTIFVVSVFRRLTNDNDTYDLSRSVYVVVLDTFAVCRLGRRAVVHLPTAIINFSAAAAAAAAVLMRVSAVDRILRCKL